MSDLTTFVLARIAEDEATVNALADESYNSIDGPISTGDDPWPSEAAFAAHITPARVLRECEAKRRIVARHADCGLGYGYCDDGGKGIWREEDGGPACADLFDLATAYSDHAEFQEAWRP